MYSYSKTRLLFIFQCISYLYHLVSMLDQLLWHLLKVEQLTTPFAMITYEVQPVKYHGILYTYFMPSNGIVKNMCPDVLVIDQVLCIWYVTGSIFNSNLQKFPVINACACYLPDFTFVLKIMLWLTIGISVFCLAIQMYKGFKGALIPKYLFL